MAPQSSLPDDEVLVLDTSVVINLSATGCAREILGALPYRIVVVDTVVGELDYGKSKGRGDAAMLAELAAADTVEIATLGELGLSHFEGLVVGASADTLDDGEAATIAYAIETLAFPVIDERKALRLCSRRFPDLKPRSTLDLLSHQAVQQALGLSHLADALHRALLGARMQVPAGHMSWVVSLIGNERAADCQSLPETVRKTARSSGQAAAG